MIGEGNNKNNRKKSKKVKSKFPIKLTIISGFIFLILLIGIISAAVVKYEYYEPTTDSTRQICENYWSMQSFTIGTTGADEAFDLNTFSVKAYRTGNPGTINAVLKATDVDNKPTGAILDIASFDGDALTTSTSGELVNITNWANNYELQASTGYAVIFNITNGGNCFTNELRILNIESGSYAGGFTSETSNGVSYGADAGRDMWFQTWGLELNPDNATSTLVSPSNDSTSYIPYVNFLAYVNDTGGGGIVNASLIIDGTTNTTIYNTTANENLTLNVPLNLSTGFHSWYINFSVANGEEYTSASNYSFTISSSVFGLCNATLTIPYMNFTFLDESDSSYLNGSVTANFHYWTTDNLINFTTSFTNTTENPSYAFCFVPSDKNISVDYSITYESSGYTTRTYAPPYRTFTNSSTSLPLYLLGSADGLYVTLQIINPAEQAISGADIIINKTIGGTTHEIAAGTTGADGAATFWLDPNSPHTIVVDAPGYDLYTTSLTPTQTSYTIQLGSTGTIPSDYTKGISYSVYPIDINLENNTAYNFNYTISSTYWSLDEFGFVLQFENGTEIASNSSTSISGGIVSVSQNTLTYDTFVMNYYWVVNGTYQNGTKTWIIYDSSGQSFSLWNFAKNFVTYLNSGLFGIDNFGVGLIAFFICFGAAGIVSYKFGVTNPASIIALIWALVAVMDVGLGLIPNPVGAVDNFPTILVSIVAVGMIAREVTR